MDGGIGLRNGAEAERERALVAALFEAAIDGLVTMDESGRIVAVNPAACRMFGYEAAELVGQDAGIFMPQPEGNSHRTYVEQYLKTGRSSILGRGREVVGRRRDGSLFPLSLAVTEARTPDGVCFAGVLRDMTEEHRRRDELESLNRELERLVRERTARLEEAVRELEGFSHSVAHDLRAPLRVINGNARMLLEDAREALDSESIERLETIAATSVRLAKTMDDLLQYARLSRVPIVSRPIDLSGVVRAVHEGLALPCTLEVQANVMAEGNPDLIRMAVMNLLENAAKYHRPGRETHVRFGKEGDAYFVADDGVGFDMDQAQGLFEPFKRLHGADFPGTGIGLANTRRIVERHGGRIWASSAPGVGTTFYFTLHENKGVEASERSAHVA
ncbi:MAG: PAS domain S-box protein [Fimbriimonadaceae bacterium]|nr:PAS domain S-box protein [Fimbriimonadaceae bacterium]